MPRESPQELRVLVAFFNSVGISLGFYDRKTKCLKEGIENEPLYISNRDIIKKLLKEGWTAPELEKYLWERYRVKDRAALISDIVPMKPGRELQEDENILFENKIYRHPRLYTKSPPVLSTEDEAIKLKKSPILEPIGHFTLKDLVDYYFEKAYEVEDTKRTRTTTMGTIRWLLQDCSPDEILTAIDLATEYNPLVSSIKIESFIREAKTEIKLRMGNA